ncbi:hypothetical protein KOW79_000731 [Hemibagrus wyckioides]|uniref:Uncharacterized protein n=1 Tax=Hemibagrus wyckioides TaxID=337641 RepID=A0A9D3P7C6_9TELE|nr:uncharacterized protein zgc:174935 [Hemibagrus wyckioides]KAG7336038.1 hypothetical protein KOW79_000731 [Hemibagrus wyckioides]
MRSFAVVVGLLVAFTLGLLGIIHSRKNLVIQLISTNHFESVKNKVTSDVLNEFQSNIAEATIRLEQTKKELQELSADVKGSQEVADGKKAELKTCNSDLSQIKDEIGSLEAERSKSDTEFQKSKSSLTEQISNLKKELEKRSKVCDYITKNSVEGMKLCGIVPVLQAEPNPGAAKAA